MRSVSPRSIHSARGNLNAAVRFMTPSARCHPHRAHAAFGQQSLSCHGPMRSPVARRRMHGPWPPRPWPRLGASVPLVPSKRVDPTSTSNCASRRLQIPPASAGNAARHGCSASTFRAQAPPPSNPFRRCQSAAVSSRWVTPCVIIVSEALVRTSRVPLSLLHLGHSPSAPQSSIAPRATAYEPCGASAQGGGSGTRR